MPGPKLGDILPADEWESFAGQQFDDMVSQQMSVPASIQREPDPPSEPSPLEQLDQHIRSMLPAQEPGGQDFWQGLRDKLTERTPMPSLQNISSDLVAGRSPSTPEEVVSRANDLAASSNVITPLGMYNPQIGQGMLSGGEGLAGVSSGAHEAMEALPGLRDLGEAGRELPGVRGIGEGFERLGKAAEGALSKFEGSGEGGAQRAASRVPAALRGDVPLYELTADELREMEPVVAGREHADLVEAFGTEDEARRFERLDRTANGSNVERADAASKELAAMTDGLGPEREALVYGSRDDPRPTIEDVRDFRRAAETLDFASPEALGRSLRFALVDVGHEADPAAMTAREQLGYAQIRAATEGAVARGWDFEPIRQAAMSAAKARFADPEDAQFVLRRFLTPASAQLTEGAPRITAPAPIVRGKRDVVNSVQNPGTQYEFQYEAVPLDSLVTSQIDPFSMADNPNFPKALQVRGRERAASRIQVTQNAQQLDPNLLLEDTSTLDRGAPIIGPDNVVESGNGRTLSMVMAAQDNPDRWSAYQAALRQQAAQVGIDPAALERMANPVLVRRRITPMGDAERAAFTHEANGSTAMRMSAVEQARADAAKMNPTVVSNLTVGDEQSIDQALRSPGNREVIRSFMSTVPEAERGELLDENGYLNRDGLARVKHALLARTYGGVAGDHLASALTESLGDEARNVETAVFRSLPTVAKAEALIQMGERDPSLSVTTDVAQVANVITRLRQEGTPVARYLNQAALFGRELSPSQEALLQALDQMKRSPKRMASVLENYANSVIDMPSANQTEMFGGSVGRPSKEALVEQAIRNALPEQQPGLFGATAEVAAHPLPTALEPAEAGVGGGAGPRSAEVGSGEVQAPQPAGGPAVPEPAEVGLPPPSVQRLSEPRNVRSQEETRQAIETATGRETRTQPEAPVEPPAEPPSPPEPPVSGSGTGGGGDGAGAGGTDGVGSGSGGVRPPAHPRQDLPKDLPAAGILDKFDVRDSFPMLREIERRATEAAGVGAARPHALAVQMPGGKLEADIILEKELRPILREVTSSGATVEDLNAFMRNTEAVQEEGLGLVNPGGLTAKDATANLEALRAGVGQEKYDALVKAEKDIQDYQTRNFLERARGQFVSDDQIAAYTDKRTHYFPHIVLDFIAEHGDTLPTGRPPISVATNELARARAGSTREVMDPLDAVVARTYRINAALTKNEAATAIIDALKQVDPAYVKPRTEGAPLPSAYKTISRIVDGKKETYVVDGRLGIDDQALKALSSPQIHPVIRAIAAINNVSKVAFTSVNPNFLARNPIFDQFDAHFREGLSPFGYHAMMGFWSAITKDANYEAWARGHGGLSGFLEEASLSNASKTVADLARSPLERGVRLVANPLGLLSEANRILEEGTRIGVYTQKSGALRGPALPGPLRGLVGGPETDAVTAIGKSREATVDFANGHALVRAVNPVVMFLNANVKGGFNAIEPLLRGGKDLSNPDRLAATVRLGTMMGAAGALWAYNQRFGDLYDQIPQYERDNRLIFINPVQPTVTDERGHTTPNYFALPKPVPLRIFWNFAEDAYRYVANQNPRTGQELANEALGIATPMSSVTEVPSSLVPPAIGWLPDIKSNWDPFRGRQIETRALQQLPRELRYEPGTSDAARALATTDAAETAGLSPVQIDYIANKVFGGTARSVEWAVGKVGEQIGAFPKRPETDPYIEASRAPITGVIARSQGGADDQRAYDRRDEELRTLNHDNKALIMRMTTNGAPLQADLPGSILVEGRKIPLKPADQVLYTRAKLERLSHLLEGKDAQLAAMTPTERATELGKARSLASEYAREEIKKAMGAEEIRRRFQETQTDAAAAKKFFTGVYQPVAAAR